MEEDKIINILEEMLQEQKKTNVLLENMIKSKENDIEKAIEANKKQQEAIINMLSKNSPIMRKVFEGLGHGQ